MKKTVYDWKAGARFNADPQAVGEEIARLKSPTAAEIAAAAANGAEALHELFDAEGLWDDSIAAEWARIEFAQKIARNLVVTVRIEGGEPAETVVVRAFEAVTVTSREPRRYVPVLKALNKEEWKGEIFKRLRQELESARRQIETYDYLGDCMRRAAKHVKRAIDEMAEATA